MNIVRERNDMPSLHSLLRALGMDLTEKHIPDLPISDIAYNSKKAAPSVLFVCLTGSVTDGHRYAPDAYARGARVFVAERPLTLPTDAVVILTENTRRALAVLSAAFFDHPEEKLTIIGITGTKGKSTIAEMIRHILMENGIPAASVGTVGIRMGEDYRPTVNTTPESYELFRIFAELTERNIRHVVIEVSSQGLKLDRVFGIPFHTAIMTNLSEDHIGASEHPNFEDYKHCKKLLFKRCRHAIFNADDDHFSEFLEASEGENITCSVRSAADYTAHAIMPEKTEKDFATSFILDAKGKKTHVLLPFPGEFSVQNALAAIASTSLLGISPEQSAKALTTASVKGRFELVETPLVGVSFVIDYAHNGESLTRALTALRPYTSGRLICLFGSVGGRTEVRRREMGIAAALHADLSILTDDNPDRESSDEIITEIARHMGNAPHIAIPDRREAIEYAVSVAKEGDIVLFAGKGHESYQLVDGKKLPFSERDCILSAAMRQSVIS